jgi:hypothetical protein
MSSDPTFHTARQKMKARRQAEKRVSEEARQQAFADLRAAIEARRTDTEESHGTNVVTPDDSDTNHASKEWPPAVQASGASDPQPDTSTSEYSMSLSRERLLEELRTTYGERAVSDVEVSGAVPSRPSHWLAPVKGASRHQKVNPLALIRLPTGLTGTEWDETGATLCGVTTRAVAVWRRGFVEHGYLERRRSGRGFRFYLTEAGKKEAGRRFPSARLGRAYASRPTPAAHADSGASNDKKLPDLQFRLLVAHKCGMDALGYPELDLVRLVQEQTGRTKREVYAALRAMEAGGDVVLWQLHADHADCARCAGLERDGKGRCQEHSWVERKVSITERLHWVFHWPVHGRGGIWIPAEHRAELDQDAQAEAYPAPAFAGEA